MMVPGRWVWECPHLGLGEHAKEWVSLRDLRRPQPTPASDSCECHLAQSRRLVSTALAGRGVARSYIMRPNERSDEIIRVKELCKL